MSQGKGDLVKIHLALIAAQDTGGGGLFKFLEAQVDILSYFAAARLNKMIKKKWPAEGSTGNLALDKNARWLLGLLAPHLWKTKIEPEELIASFQEGTGRIGYLPDGVLRTLHGTLDSSMSGWSLKEVKNPQTQAWADFYHFPPLEEAREIFAAKHGDVGWPATDEVAMVKVREAAEAEAEAEAEYLRNRDSFNGLLRDHRDAIGSPRARIHQAEKRHGITCAKACEKDYDDPAAQEFLRETAEDRSALAALDVRFAEQCRRNSAGEALLGPDEVWPLCPEA